MLEDQLLKAKLISRGVDGGKASGKLPYCSRAGTNVGVSVASHSVCSLPTISQSTGTEQMPLLLRTMFEPSC